MLSIAAGRVDITPLPPIAIGIDARNAKHCDGVLEANMIAFEGLDGAPIVLVQIDTMFLDDAFHAALSGKIGIGKERIALLASHSHSTPMLTGELAPPATCERAYADDVAEKIAVLIKELLSEPTRTASTSFGRVQPDLNINRRSVGIFFDSAAAARGKFFLSRQCVMQPNISGPVDRNLRILRFDDEGGNVRAIVWGYAAHPSRQPDRHAVSADFPGTVRARLREHFGSDVAVLYVPGLAGSTAPRVPFSFPRDLRTFVRWAMPWIPYSPAFTPESYRSWCTLLGDQAVLAATQAHPILTIAPTCKRVCSKPIFEGQQPSGDVILNVQAIAFGANLSLAATSGELLFEWHEVLPNQRGENVWLTGYLAGRPTYVPTNQVLSEGGYEADGFLKAFDLNGRFSPELETRVTAALCEAVAESRASINYSA